MNSDNATGKFDQFKGQVKQSFGESTGNESLANEGAADQVKGHVKEAWGKVKDAFHEKSADARADLHAHEANAHEESAHTAHDVREKIVSTAQNAKDAITGKLDEMHDRKHVPDRF